MDMMGGCMGFMALNMLIWTLIGLGILTGVLILLFRLWRHEGRATILGDQPEEILRRRYASGDIDQTEFESRLTELRKGR